jgi:hypothetical protein
MFLSKLIKKAAYIKRLSNGERYLRGVLCRAF